MKFSRYDVDELTQCGEAFLARAKQIAKPLDQSGASTRHWTDFILDWFAATAGDGMTVRALTQRAETSWQGLLAKKHGQLPAPREGTWEFLLDLVHTTVPRKEDGESYQEYWANVLEASCETHLALECEWGKSMSDKSSFGEVMWDAWKLAAVRASAKVMVLGTSDGSACEEVMRAVSCLRTQSRDSAPWLCVDLPWYVAAPNQWKPSAWILSGKEMNQIHSKAIG